MVSAINMWISLLLFSYVQSTGTITNGAVKWKQCPTNCSCWLTEDWHTFDEYSLLVDCQGRTDADSGRLSKEIGSMLSSNLTYDLLTSLSIVNSSLTHVLRSICRLTTLRWLYLHNNQLTRLPDCLSNLSNLITFKADDNSIETLQDGVFDGLTELTVFGLRRNGISSIGLSVFTASSNLSSLLDIDLSENNLTSSDT